MAKEKQYRGWYTHDFFELGLSEIQKLAKRNRIELADPANPTPEELREVYEVTFAEMSDPWEVTANGICKVEEYGEVEVKESSGDDDEDEDEDIEDEDDEDGEEWDEDEDEEDEDSEEE